MSDEEEEELYEETDEESETNEPEEQEEEVIEEFCREDEPIEQPEIEKVMKMSITEIHPQEKVCNYEEVLSLCTITRDEAHNIIDPFHTTIPILTKYEYTRILGVRATQIENGAPTFIDAPELVDSYLIAKAELDQKKLPFILKRPIPNGTIEYWKLEDLEILV